MKQTTLLLSVLILLFSGCKQGIEKQNHFSSDLDTLIIKTEKIKGNDLLPTMVYSLYLQDTSDFYDFQIIYPENINHIKISTELIDFKPYRYGNMKKNNSDYLETFLNDNFPDKIDTSNIPSKKVNSICIMTGLQGRDQVFIVDQNNNKDFSDDSIRAFRKMDWQLKPEPIKCHYNIYNGKEIVQDSGWINLGTDRNNELSFFVAHNMVADFSLDHVDYKVQFVNGPPFARFCFENPILAIVGQDGVKKDSLLKSENIEIGEYLRFGKFYYRFDDVSNDGKYLMLVREKDVSSKIGTQPGFIAPNFTCQSITGDSISLTDYKGKYLLIANITSCWSEIMSYEYYKELTQKYASKFDFIGIDNSPLMLQQNIKNLNLIGSFIIAENNSTIQSNYREDYCSRTCFLINPEGRVIERFEICDWQTSLAKYLD